MVLMLLGSGLKIENKNEDPGHMNANNKTIRGYSKASSEFWMNLRKCAKVLSMAYNINLTRFKI